MMSKMLFKRAVATGAAFVALGFGGATSVSSPASAANVHPAAAHTVQVPQAHQSTGWWCRHGYPRWWPCWRHRPPFPRPYPDPGPYRYRHPEHRGYPDHGGNPYHRAY
jgi:hypothetical protein